MEAPKDRTGGSAAKPRRRRLLRLLALVLVLALLLGAALYLADYYRASPEALAAISAPPEGITVQTLEGKGVAFIPEDPAAGLIFYPGGKVACEAYAPLMVRFAQKGILCVLLKMPLNLAVLAPNAAEGVAERFPRVERWYLGGHSLGGVMAARWAAAHAGELEGLLLLASYSTEDLRESGLKVLSLVGTEDGVLNREKYEDAKKNLPADAAELVIEGGSHAQFGSYGLQSGDGAASVSPALQWERTASAFAALLAGE